jgi:hypothetical protein
MSLAVKEADAKEMLRRRRAREERRRDMAMAARIAMESNGGLMETRGSKSHHLWRTLGQIGNNEPPSKVNKIMFLNMVRSATYDTKNT